MTQHWTWPRGTPRREVNGSRSAARNGSVRLQEANLGLAAVAVISSVLHLRQYAPVITVIAGTVGASAACRSQPESPVTSL